MRSSGKAVLARTTKASALRMFIVRPQPFWEQIKVVVWKEEHKEFSILE